MQTKELYSAISLALTALGTTMAYAAELSISHANPSATYYEIQVQPGERINVAVRDTCPESFTYQSQSFTTQPPEAGNTSAAAGDEVTCPPDKAKEFLTNNSYCRSAQQKFSFVHESSTNAYNIVVTLKGEKKIKLVGEADYDAAIVSMANTTCAIPKSLKTTEIGSTTYSVRAAGSPWALGMSGGLVASSVTDPKFAIIPDSLSTTVPPPNIVIRDTNAEDNSSLGFAGFIHLHNEKWIWRSITIAPTFGLGIGADSEINGFAGVAFGAWDLGYVVMGWNWRPVDRLPSGQRLNEAPINDNILTDLPTKIDDGWFIGFSFKLMSPGDSFFEKKTVTPAADKPADGKGT